MKRLIDGIGKNSPEEYDRIYETRSEKPVEEADYERWMKLLKYYRGGALLDMGCLDSLVPILAKGLYQESEVWGIDTAENCIYDMQKKFPECNFDTRNVYKTSFPDEYFNYVVAGELIEHLNDPEKCIKEAFRVLKEGGTFALSTPKDEEEEVGAVDEERHVWSISTDDIHSLLSPYGDVKIKIIRSKYFPKYEYRWPTILAYVKKNTVR